VSKETSGFDALVADLASVRDDELLGEVRSSLAATLLATIVKTPVGPWDLAGVQPALAIDSSSRGARRERTGRRRVGLIALAAALALAVVLSTAAFGVVRDIGSFFAGWHDPEAAVPTAPDVVIASGEAGAQWRIVATTSDRGLCLALVIPSEDSGTGDCRPTDVRGDPWAGDSARHWIGAFGVGGGNSVLNRNFALGPLAEEVASVELILTDGETVRAHVVKRPEGLDAPLNFYWTTWSCGSSNRQCVDGAGPEVKMAIARDEAGRVLERRVPTWNGNPTGDPEGPPPPS
jgi:hypothetical protein